jgi:hypothetical protein
MTREEEILEIILKHAAGATNTLADGVHYHNAALEIASLPLEVPTAGDIEKQFPYAQSYGNYCRQEGATWAISEILKRNK